MKGDLWQCGPIMKEDNKHHRELHKQIDKLKKDERFGDPKYLAELFGVKKKLSRPEAIGYLAGFYDGTMVGSFNQYISNKSEGWMKSLEKAEKKFHGRKIRKFS
jgi:hypothetical protein